MISGIGSYIEVEGCLTFFEEQGEGPPVLFLAPAGRENSHWRRSLSHFSGRYRCIAPDLPGHGKSGFLPGEKLYHNDILALANFLKSFLSNLGVEKTAVIGCSLGGNLCYAMGALYPDLARVLVPLQGALYTPVLNLAGLEMLVHPHVNLIHGLADNAGSLVGRRSSSEGRRFIVDTVSSVNPRALKADLTAYCQTDLRSIADQISAHVLAVHGTDDWLVSRELIDATIQKLVKAKSINYVPMEGIGHFPHIESPDDLFAIVDPFLSKFYLC